MLRTVQALQMPVSEDVEELRRRLENALLRGMMQDRDAAPLHQQNGYPVRIMMSAVGSLSLTFPDGSNHDPVRHRSLAQCRSPCTALAAISVHSHAVVTASKSKCVLRAFANETLYTNAGG